MTLVKIEGGNWPYPLYCPVREKSNLEYGILGELDSNFVDLQQLEILSARVYHSMIVKSEKRF